MSKARTAFAVLFWLALCAGASAQGCGSSNPNCIVPTRPPGDDTNAAASTAFVTNAVGGGGSAITALTGDVTATGPGSAAATIAAGAVTGGKIASGTITGSNIASNTIANSNLANMAAGTIKGNNTGSTAAPLDLTGLQVSDVAQFLSPAGTGLSAVSRSIASKSGDWVSVQDFGASASQQTTTGTIGATSTSLALAAAIDFANGQGIRVNHAGPVTTVSPPTGASVAPQGTPGTTHYSYQISSVDSHGGVGAAITAFTTTTGNATLSNTNYNQITFSEPSDFSANAFAVWRTSPNPAFIGMTVTGTDTFNDMGQTAPVVPDWMPSTPPGSATARWLLTTIASGGGTTSLTLSNASTTAASGQTVAHEDSGAFLAAQNWLAYGPNGSGHFGTGGTVWIPGGRYNISQKIAWDTNGSAITWMGAGFGDDDPGNTVNGGGTFLVAQSPIECIMCASGQFARGWRMTNMTLDGMTMALIDVEMDQIDASTFDNLRLLNAGLANFQLGDGSDNTQENRLFNIGMNNTLNVNGMGSNGAVFLPYQNLDVKGAAVNNDIVNIKGANAKSTNFLDEASAAGNKYINVHGYNFWDGSAQASSTNNFLIAGSEEQIVACEADGSSSVNIEIDGNLNSVVGCFSQFQGITAQVGVRFGNGSLGNVVHGNIFTDSTLANTIVQAGTAGTGGNLFCNNWNNTASASPPCRDTVPVGFASLPACVAALAGTHQGVTDANVTAFNATITAGSSTTKGVAYCNGSAWTLH